MTDAVAQILFVDDERPILNSLKRLMRPTGHRIHIANSGSEGLNILSDNPIDVVVSDMRMPEMDGAAFLSSVAERWPQTTRMLLTGYADLTSAIDAINNGAITRYLTKPWQDTDIVMCLEQAIETQRLKREKERLEALTAKQNAELLALNEGLEQKVAERTKTVIAAKEQLVKAHEHLRASYAATVEVFSHVIQSRAGIGNRACVAHDARAIGAKMGLSKRECQALFDASLLCDIGKVSLPDSTVHTPYTRLDANAQREYQRHPIIAEATLVSLEPLVAAAKIIGMHCERFNGLGFPNKLSGDAIPVAARILAVCKSFSDLQEGNIFEQKYTAGEARAFIENEKGERFDPEVVDLFLTWLSDRRRQTDGIAERKLSLGGLSAHMKTTRDLFDDNGVLILAKDQTISDALIDRLVRIQQTNEQPFAIYVRE